MALKYLLDTDTCIYMMNKRPTGLEKKLAAFKAGELGISSITLAELQFGVEKSSQPVRNQEALDEFVAPLEVAEFGDDAAYQYGIVRADLEKKGKLIGSNGLFIAAHALALKVALVTNNAREFSRVPGLKHTNWF